MKLEEVLEAHKKGAYDNIDQSFRYQPYTTSIVVNSSGSNEQSGICHMNAAMAAVDSAQTNLAVITAGSKALAKIPEAVEFFDFILNKSALAPAFLVKDAKLSLEHGFVKTIDTYGPIFLLACQLSRLPFREYHEEFKTFLEVFKYEKEINPLLLCGIIVTNKARIKDDSIQLTYSISNNLTNYLAHAPFVSIFNKERLKDYLEGNRENKPSHFRHTVRESRVPWRTGASNAFIKDSAFNLTDNSSYNLSDVFSSVKVPFKTNSEQFNYRGRWSKLSEELSIFRSNNAKGKVNYLNLKALKELL